MSRSIAPEDDSTWQRREAVLEQFEIAWQEQGGPAIEDFLSGGKNNDRQPLLIELIKIDLEYGWGNGKRPHVEDYLRQFPELADCSELVKDLVREEKAVRCHHGCGPGHAELAERFGDELADDVHTGAEPTLLACKSEADDHGGPAVSDGRRTSHAALPARLGRYEVREIKGRGGCATVYRGWDPQLRREVAIKVPRAELLGDADARERLLREATSAAQLRHPAIVQIYEAGTQDDLAYIVFQYIPGPSLAEAIARTPPAQRQAAEWVARLADALDYAHRSGIVHRDVKPSNVLMDADGLPMVSDFGLALHSDGGPTLTREGDLLGTPAYMSPEQARQSHHVDARSDVYSLGVLLYELLCGKRPFEGPGHSVLLKVLHDEPSTPRRHRAETPLDLETICLKAMSKEPGRRYATAGALADDLRRWLDHRPIVARRIGLAGRLSRWVRRRPALAATIAGALVTIAAVSAVSFLRIIHERDRFHAERDRAEGNLYRSLVSDARSQLRSRDTGWWWQAMENVRNAARLDVKENNPAELRELAIQCMGSEYPCFRLRQTFQGHAGPVTAIAFPPGERFIVSSSRDKTVRLWRLAGGRPLAILADFTAPVTALACHPDGAHVAAGAADGTVRIWPVADLLKAGDSGRALGGPIESVVAHSIALGKGPVRALAYSPDGGWLAAAWGGRVHLVAAARQSPSADKVLRLQQSAQPIEGATDVVEQTSRPDPATDFEDGTPARRPDPNAPPSSDVICLAFSHDGQRLATGAADKTVRIWDLASGEVSDSWPVAEVPKSLLFDREGDALLWADHERFGFSRRELVSGSQRAYLNLHTDAVVQLLTVVSPRESSVVTASSDGTLKAWSAFDAPVEMAVARGGFGWVSCAAASPHGGMILAGHGNGEIRLWELASPSQRIHAPTSNQVVFVGGGHRLATAEGVLDLNLDPAASPGAMMPYGEDHAVQRAGDVLAVAVSPDGRSVATAGPDRALRLWEASSLRLTRTMFMDDEDPLACVVFSPDSKQVASASDTVHVWEVDTGSEVHRFAASEWQISSLAFHPRRPWLAVASKFGTVRFWDLRSGKPGEMLHRFIGHCVRGIAFQPSGRWLAAACDNQMVALWDLGEQGAPPAPRPPDRLLAGHTSAVRSVGFSSDGRWLASSADQGRILLWDTRSFSRITALEGGTGQLRSVAFSRDGRLLAASGLLGAGFDRQRTIVWDLEKVRSTLREMELDW